MRPPSKEVITLPRLLELHERLIIVQTLTRHGFSRSRTATALGISRTHLWRRMKRLGIDAERTTPGRPSRKIDT